MTPDRFRVLIVEDDLATLFALRSLFVRKCSEVAVARSIAEAEASIRAAVPDWIVLDLGLPDGNGETILRYVRANSLAARVAVTSAYLDDRHIARLIELEV